MARDIQIQDQKQVGNHYLRVMDVKAFESGEYRISGYIHSEIPKGNNTYRIHFSHLHQIDEALQALMDLRTTWATEEKRLEKRSRQLNEERDTYS